MDYKEESIYKKKVIFMANDKIKSFQKIIIFSQKSMAHAGMKYSNINKHLYRFLSS